MTIPIDNASVIVDVAYSGLSGPVDGGSHPLGDRGSGRAGGSSVHRSARFALHQDPHRQPTTSPRPGAPPDFPTFVTALKDGGAGYVNLHTNACKGGEIRAEVQ